MKYDANSGVVQLSVRELCELAFTGGDLDLRLGSRRKLLDAAQIGSGVHRRLQAAAGVQYRVEVPLCHTARMGDLSIEVSGRADGVISTEPMTVDEIKTVTGRILPMSEHPLHLAQAKCYAYFLACEKNLSTVSTRLTYCRAEDGELKYLIRTHTKEELETFYRSLLKRIYFRAELCCRRKTERLPSAAAARFPYASVRRGQDLMIKECYRDIRAKKRLFVEAPTGIGKTLSSLYPAVRALGEGHCSRIFYLTAKASGKREAFRAAEKLYGAGARLYTLSFSSKEQLCLSEEARVDPRGISHHCNPRLCPYAKGFYDRCEAALEQLISQKSLIDRTAVMEFSRAFSICPYEFQLMLSELCDVIICDYNYVFDPQIYLRRFFDAEAEDLGSCVFLIDEAHNLADRAAEMYSATLSLVSLREAKAALPPTERGLCDLLGALETRFVGMRSLCRDSLETDGEGIEHGYYLNRAPMEDFHRLVEETAERLEEALRMHREEEWSIPVEGLLSELRRFVCISEYYDERFLTFLSLCGRELTLRLSCLDPSRILDACLGRARAAVLFSATLTPSDYFVDLLGGGKRAATLSLPSPFDPKRCAVIAVPSISTRYADRADSYRKLASMIAATASAKVGNYIVYFPSYEYLQSVAEVFAKKYPHVPLVLQERGMTHAQKEAFLEAFCEDGRLRVGFCVLGGSFSEGVDLPGRRLIGTVIVGTGLPGLSSERNILKEYYDTTRESGFDYAYTYPGWNRVLQAAGRVIRREEDSGIIVLIDDRYVEPKLQALFPEHWRGVRYARNSKELADIAANFWDNFK